EQHRFRIAAEFHKTSARIPSPFASSQHKGSATRTNQRAADGSCAVPTGYATNKLRGSRVLAVRSAMPAASLLYRYGIYHDELAKFDREWKFTQRIFVPFATAVEEALSCMSVPPGSAETRQRDRHRVPASIRGSDTKKTLTDALLIGHYAFPLG